MIKKFLAALLAVMMLPGAVCALGEGFYEEMPPLLRFSQRMETTTVGNNTFDQRIYPDTQSDEVDAQIAGLIDAMAQENLPLLPKRAGDVPAVLETGAVISRSGESVLSFLVLSEITSQKELCFSQAQARVYDIADGRLLTLDDFFAPESGAWALLAQQARGQLSAAFPQEEPDAQALDALCTADALCGAAFTLGAARLTLTYRADTLYPGKPGLLHVHVYYPEIREMMTPYGQRQTDNSRFKMIALTYDDGGARNSTRRVTEELRAFGAQATFFIVGKNIRNNHDIHLKQHNANHSIQSHTYSHRYPGDIRKDEAFAERERFSQELAALTGAAPTMMRAPGGNDGFFVRYEFGYPVMHWSLPSGDSGTNDAEKIANRVKGGAQDGDIVLMHDLNGLSPVYTRDILADLTDRGFLCVTIEELFADAGVPLERDRVYFSPYRVEGTPGVGVD